jgi:hypothetical protein
METSAPAAAGIQAGALLQRPEPEAGIGSPYMRRQQTGFAYQGLLCLLRSDCSMTWRREKSSTAMPTKRTTTKEKNSLVKTLPVTILRPVSCPSLPDSIPRDFSTASSLIRGYVLGSFQPSLRDCSSREMLPRTTSWATLNRPYGTQSFDFSTASSLIQDCVLGGFQPSLRD